MISPKDIAVVSEARSEFRDAWRGRRVRPEYVKAGYGRMVG